MSAAVPAAASRTTWTIDPVHSSVEFAVRHLMITTVKGRFAEVSGTVVLDPAEPAASTAEIAIGAASIDTREAQRDAHLRSADFFDVDKFPAITFRSTRLEGAPDRPFRLVGELTMRGVSREVLLAVTPEGRSTDPWGGTRSGFSATTTIRRSDFGLTWNQLLETGGLAVSDEVRISIELQLIAQPAQG
jgi:polyisoprenoid-binding protein YceI